MDTTVRNLFVFLFETFGRLLAIPGLEPEVFYLTNVPGSVTICNHNLPSRYFSAHKCSIETDRQTHTYIHTHTPYIHVCTYTHIYTHTYTQYGILQWHLFQFRWRYWSLIKISEFDWVKLYSVDLVCLIKRCINLIYRFVKIKW